MSGRRRSRPRTGAPRRDPRVSSMRSPRPAASTRRRPSASISGLWSSPTTRQPWRRATSIADGGRPAGDVEDGVDRPGLDARGEERAPARVLAEAEEPRVAVVRPGQRREELAGGAVSLRGWGDHAAIVAPREPRGGAERSRRGRPGAARSMASRSSRSSRPSRGSGARVYLCAYERTVSARGSHSTPRGPRSPIACSFATPSPSRPWCELAEESAGGGDSGTCARGWSSCG